MLQLISTLRGCLNLLLSQSVRLNGRSQLQIGFAVALLIHDMIVKAFLLDEFLHFGEILKEVVELLIDIFEKAVVRLLNQLLCLVKLLDNIVLQGTHTVLNKNLQGVSQTFRLMGIIILMATYCAHDVKSFWFLENLEETSGLHI